VEGGLEAPLRGLEAIEDPLGLDLWVDDVVDRLDP
jgi:hypothetical protein